MNPGKLSAPYAFSEASIKEAAIGFQKIRVLLTAYELGLFSALGGKARSARDVARALNTKASSTERLMHALCGLGLLKKNKGLFTNSGLAKRFLVRKSPEYIAGLMHSVHMWDSWSTLTQAVRRGKTVLARRFDKRGKDWLVAFIAAMHEHAIQQAEKIASLIGLSGVRSVLDVGGGSGAYAMAFARLNKGLRATVFDLPGVVPLTRKYISRNGLSDRVKTVGGDFTTDGLGRGFDLVFLSAIIHSNSFAENSSLIRKCAKALNPGGRVVVQDFIVDENRTAPAFATLFALNMLVATEAGDVYTQSEVSGWMKKAGLRRIKRRNTEFGTSLIIGKK